MKIKRVVIWGHKKKNTFGVGNFSIKSHTHSYIHAGYFEAFQRLGFETIWIDNVDDLPIDSNRGHLFFTEGQVDNSMPVSKENYYVTHHSNPEKYREVARNWVKLHNFVADLLEGMSFNYPASTVQKIDHVTFWDDKNSALYQPWATDIFPGEESDFPPIFAKSTKTVNYVGTINHDGIELRFRQIRTAARRLGYSIRTYSGVSDERARKLMRDSAVCFDVRGDWHLSRGYVPCRLWKTLSYGRAVASNSSLLSPIFRDHILIESNSSEFFEAALQNESQASLSKIRDSQAWVIRNHTFINRARRILEVLEID